MTNTLIKTLQQREIFNHAVDSFKVIETHISWVILTGQIAYKIKKPVNLGFLDFTTLEKRKQFCEQELKLNQRLAPELYIDVVAITGTIDAPSLKNPGEPIEYAVKMHQFSQNDLLNIRAKHHALSIAIFDNIASQIALFHQHVERCDSTLPYGRPKEVWAPMDANFHALRALPISEDNLDTIKAVEQWAQVEFKNKTELIQLRKEHGAIRACHGDLHLGNIVLISDKPVIFDCIEFNEPFRWIDVINDIGFLAMDLDHVGQSELSHYLINRYCELTCDYEGVPLLRLYQCYRAMVRAKVTAFQLQMDLSAAQKQSLQTDLDAFLALAKHYTKRASPSLTITFGVSGSGKTYQSQALLMKTGAIRLRSDVFRIQLEKERYSENATKAIYEALAHQAENLLRSDHSVIIDATCLKQWQRKLFLDLAMRLQIPFHILALDAPIEVLNQRIESRQDISEATPDVLTLQLKEREPLTEFEQQYVINDRDWNY